MDTFMDKLAQKLNAQEMIRANSAAEAEELGKLRNQIKEYNECLEKLQKLLDDGANKLAGAQVNGAELNRLIEESIAKINEIQKDNESIEEMKAALEQLKVSLSATIEEQKKAVTDSLEAQKAMVDTKLAECNENVHKECVKVYRNVQAVVVEEDAKLAESVVISVNGLKGKLNAILGVSIVALIASVVSIVIHILNMLNFKLF